MLPPPRQQKEARICFLLLWRKERMRLAGDIPLCNYSKLVLWADPATVPAWERRASLFKERQWFSLVVYFIRSINSVYMSVPTSQFLPSSPSPLVSIGCSLCLCLYFCFVNKILYTSFFRFYIRALIYNICRLVDVQYIYFSLLAFASMFLFENISRCKRMNLPLSLLQNIVYFSSLMYFDLSSLPA